MLFNSIEFILFFTLFSIVYWKLLGKKREYQNVFILLGSYFFYGWWDYRFLILIISSTLVDFYVAKLIPIQNSLSKQKFLLSISILFNLTLLGFFKYFNFFIDSFINFFQLFGIIFSSDFSLKIILPVGISFYTFQTMSYTIDVFRKQITPTNNLIEFGCYVSFFPQLVAGPIEKSKNLLPQFQRERLFDHNKCIKGFHLIIWGLFKKIIIADSISPVVDEIFNNYEILDGGTLWLGLLYFSIQIYCDFSGYSDIAVGTAKILGIDLMDNFKFPYFSENIPEFWKRWHISLTSWFTDYFYLPLKFRYRESSKTVNLFVLIFYFILIGLWHGSNWTFIAFGIYHCLFFIPTIFSAKFYFKNGKKSSNYSIINFSKKITNNVFTFIFISIGWVFFRSETINDALNYFIKLFYDFIPEMHRSYLISIVFPFMILEYLRFKFDINVYSKFRIFLLSLETIIVYYIIYKLLFENNFQQFIYFQF